ncbi:14303_t:CDS:2, partial [Cetraspora pellucida]
DENNSEYIINNKKISKEGFKTVTSPIWLEKKLDKEISEAIRFVNKVIHVKQLSDTEKACYTAVQYIFYLILNEKKKIKPSKVVTEVIDNGPWLARCIRK